MIGVMEVCELPAVDLEPSANTETGAKVVAVSNAVLSTEMLSTFIQYRFMRFPFPGPLNEK